MDFSSAFFLYYFLPAVLLVYYLIPSDKRKIIAVVSSVIFYAWGSTWFVFILLLALLIDFWLATKATTDLESKKKYLIASLVLNLSPLVYYKLYYINIHPSETWLDYAIPIGLSMIFLQRIAYTIDIYRDQKLHLSNFIDYAFYHLFFPKLITGPFTNLSEFTSQIVDNPKLNIWDNLQIGLQRFAIGFIKKIIIANTLAIYTNESFAHVGEISTANAFVVLLAFGVQLFFELSAYADMAIGLARAFGYILPENFLSPYLSKSITEFWKNWFSTITNWFKKYIYETLEYKIPSVPIRIALVFFSSILLIGASGSFALFFVFHAILIILEKSVLKNFVQTGKPILRHIYTSFLIFISWMFFRLNSLEDVLLYIQNLFGKTTLAFDIDLEKKFYIILVLGLFLIYWSKIPYVSSKLQELKNKPFYSIGIAILFLFAVSYATTLVNNGYLLLRF